MVSIPFRVLVGFLQETLVQILDRPDFLFQSLSGFWWGFCSPGFRAMRPGERGFQSLSGFWWGFCARGSATSRFGGSGKVSIPFRVLVGFLQFPLGKKTTFRPFLVSIPFRVLVGFLQVGCTEPYPLDCDMFQSLSGFWWGFCGRGDAPCFPPPRGRFNPFQGFGGVSAR